MDPINYSVDVQTPFQAAVQGYQVGTGIRQIEAQQAQQQQQQQVLQSLIRNPNAGAAEYSQAMLLVPGLKDQLKQAWDTKSTAQQQAHLVDLSQYGAAVQSGHPEIAVNAMRQRADAMEKTAGGPTPESQALRANAGVIEAHPDFGGAVIKTWLAAIPGGDKVIDSIVKLGQEQRAQDQAPADLLKKTADASKASTEASVAQAAAPAQAAKPGIENQNLMSQIAERGARLGLDRDKLTTDTQLKLTEMNQKFSQLPDDARKLVNESAMQATGSEQSTQQYADLASKIDALGGSWGTASSAHEFLKRVTGSEDAVSALKREYTRMASQGVIKLLPPGPASDKDIENAKAGIPDANANPAVVASYLRGMAKLSAYDAALNNAKAEWAGSVQHLGRAKSDLLIDGIKVPAGTTFNEFARQFVQKKADSMYGSAVVQKRGYMRFAQPQTPAASGASGDY